MAARDLYKSLSKKMGTRKERLELQDAGATIIANLFKEQNKDMKKANENFAKGNENVMQQMINYEDAQIDAQWFEAEKGKAQTLNLSLEDHLVEEAYKSKKAALITQLGTSQDQYNVDKWARDLAEEQRGELSRIFNAGYNKAVSTDWDNAGFEDFRILHDGRSDNVGSAAWNLIKSPFTDKDPEVTGDMLAQRLEDSVYGKDSAAMIGYRTALRDGYGLDTALDVAAIVQDREDNDYRLPIIMSPKEPFLETGNLGPATVFEITTPGIEQTRKVIRFGVWKVNADTGEEEFELNVESQAIWEKGHSIETREIEQDRNGETYRVTEQILVNQNGDFLEVLNTRSSWVNQAPTPALYARTANPSQLTAAQGALTRAIQTTFGVGDPDGYPQHKIDGVVDAYLGITAAAGDREPESQFVNRVTDHMHSRVYAQQKQLEDHGFSESQARGLSAIMMAEEIKSGIERDRKGRLDEAEFLSSLKYDTSNIFMSTERGFNPLHIINAYASSEITNPMPISAPALARILESGSVGMELTEENRESYERTRDTQLENGSYIPSLMEAVTNAVNGYSSNNSKIIDEIVRRSTVNPEYRTAVEELIGDLSVISRR